MKLAVLSAAAAVSVASLLPGVRAQGACGNATLSLSSTQPNVLIIGDSISMAVPYTPGGYGVPVQQILGGKGVFAQHGGGWFSGGQASNTPKGLNCTDASNPDGYLPSSFQGTFDVISFNYGLHDLVNCSDNPECSEHVDIPTYAQNVATIYARLAARAKTVIFQTTTPVPNVTTSLGRSYQSAIDYNLAAIQSLKAASGGAIVISDLWSAVIKFCGVGYTSCSLQLPANVHFAPAGQTFLGNAVANGILQILGKAEG
jgi:hypothetical protein